MTKRGKKRQETIIVLNYAAVMIALNNTIFNEI